MRRLALRDTAVLLATLGLWAADAQLRGTGGAAATAIAIGAGTLTALVGYLVHEWGHLLAARASGSVVHLPERLASVFLFRFDADRNSRAQFLAMSMGGFVASGLSVALLIAVLPRGTTSGVAALALTGLGVLATIVLEFPTFWRVARGAPIPNGAAYVSSRPNEAAG
jgi:hypothetical protein